jgi:hypothetical protein
MGLATSSFSLTWACAKEVNPPALSGMSTALTNMGGFLGGALLQPLAGALIDRAWNGTMLDGVRIYAPEHFTAAIACLAGAAALGFLGACLVRETRARNQWQNPA